MLYRGPAAASEACKLNFASVTYLLIIAASWGKAETSLKQGCISLWVGDLYTLKHTEEELWAGAADAVRFVRQAWSAFWEY